MAAAEGRVRRLATAGLSAGALLLAAGGCGSETRASSSPHRVDIRIEIAASPHAGAPVRTWRLRCGPPAGDWPDAAGACKRLRADVVRPISGETRDLRPISSQPVRVRGRAFGRSVALAFPARGSSTRLERLRALERALGERAFAEARRRSR